MWDRHGGRTRLTRKAQIGARINDIAQIFSLLLVQAEEALRLIGSGMVIDTLGG